MVKVILKEDLKGWGRKGDIIEVAPGFARNYLFPQGKAYPATPGAVEKIKKEREKEAKQEEKKKKEMTDIAEKLKKVKLTIKIKGEKGKLFGSVNAKTIIGALKKKEIEIPQKALELKKPIKETGKHKINFSLGEDIKGSFQLDVSESK